ncbi:MAG: hypothetical protein F4123_02045 [Gemmatimonadetes bacterium]|nr:hypothetical protein [Gemmatimonadota bacterium]MYI45171.1 hypothetical protein [Gemmatimonadota bacterium]
MARLSIAAIVCASACVVLGGPPSPDGLGYRVPSPPTATYHVADTIVVESRPFQQVREYTTTTAITLGMTFERATGGVRVVGIPETFEGAVRGGIVTRGPPPGLDDVTGTLEFVLSPLGEVDVVSLPELSGPASGLGQLASLAHELFPRLPDRVVEPGATWVDTVTWSSVGPSSEATVTSVHAYTLVGDTLVDGRSLLSIALTGEMTIELEGQVGPSALTSSSSGPVTGLVLWDAGRGLPVIWQYRQELEGTSIREGMPPDSTRRTMVRRIRLEG